MRWHRNPHEAPELASMAVQLLLGWVLLGRVLWLLRWRGFWRCRCWQCVRSDAHAMVGVRCSLRLHRRLVLGFTLVFLAVWLLVALGLGLELTRHWFLVGR